MPCFNISTAQINAGQIQIPSCNLGTAVLWSDNRSVDRCDLRIACIHPALPFHPCKHNMAIAYSASYSPNKFDQIFTLTLDAVSPTGFKSAARFDIPVVAAAVNICYHAVDHVDLPCVACTDMIVVCGLLRKRKWSFYFLETRS